MMKKFIATMMVLVIILSTICCMAEGEKVYGFKSYKPGFFTVNPDTGKSEYHYYMVLVDDATMADREVEVVDRNGVIVIVNDPEAKENRPWHKKVLAWLTFWNPDD